MRSIARWIVSRLRRYRPDSNPLRRRSDMIEAALAVAALAAVLLAAWPAALAARTVYDGGVAAERVGPGARQLVEATLIEATSIEVNVIEHSYAVPANGRGLLAASPARWTLPSGEVREGMVPAALLLLDGPGNARLWVDAAGRPAAPPPQRAETVTRAGLAAFGVVAGAAALAWTCFALARHRLDRRRYREWEAAWAAADQRWRRHHI
ncbi:Rv1733c family protein [Microbispora sp. CA-102843]|uniref:Rv1733c family protein n=1 Tax=Microbispora sp. CA-102843 TaxID=3239952 RepID=UPI003D8F9891